MPLQNPAQIDYPKTALAYTTGSRYVTPGWASTGTASQVLGAGYQYFIPIFVGETTTYIRIGCLVTVLEAAKAARLGILRYTNGLPGGVILDAGTVSLAAAAAVEIAISQQLARGFYFLTLVSDATGTAACQGWNASAVHLSPLEGFSPSLNANNYITVLRKSAESAQVAGGLTDPAPTPDGVLSCTVAGIVMLRES